MRKTIAFLTVMLLLQIFGCTSQEMEPVNPVAQEVQSDRNPADQNSDLVKAGKKAYDLYCSGCHGLAGDGMGPAAAQLVIKPRDFTSGVFKFRSTPSGSLPTDEDLYRTITRGVTGSSMPSWVLMSEKERVAVVEYIKTFSDSWQDPDNYEPPFAFPEPPDELTSAEMVAAGRIAYELMQCAQCHGETGLGDGPAASTLKDDWGNMIKPFNFTTGRLKGGPTVKDIYRTFTTGLNGTPMPSFEESLTEDQRWELTAYILYLMNKTGVTQDEYQEALAELVDSENDDEDEE